MHLSPHQQLLAPATPPQGFGYGGSELLPRRACAVLASTGWYAPMLDLHHGGMHAAQVLTWIHCAMAWTSRCYSITD